MNACQTFTDSLQYNQQYIKIFTDEDDETIGHTSAFYNFLHVSVLHFVSGGG